MRYFLEISFKGTRYSGWQVQDNARSVQQVLHEAMGTLAGATVTTSGCCRTDAGVHALQLFAHFDSDAPLDAYRYTHQLNGMLPADIAVNGLHAVAGDAHARYDAVARTYRYFAVRHKHAFLDEMAAGFYFDLDVDRMNEACSHLAGHTDYRCFARSGADTKDTRCTVREASWTYRDGLFRFTVTANRFLRGMVRAMVGTLVEVGRGRLSVDGFRTVLAGDRTGAGASAPAQGLFLARVTYPYLATEPPTDPVTDR